MDETQDYLAIQRLQRAYADVATRGAWQEVAALLTPDAGISFDTRSGRVFEIQGAEEFGAFGARMTGGFGFYEYIPLNFVVEFGDGVAHGRSYSLEVAQDAGSGAWIEFYGVYDDDYARIDGVWRFTARRYRTYGRRTDGRLEAFPLDADAGA